MADTRDWAPILLDVLGQEVVPGEPASPAADLAAAAMRVRDRLLGHLEMLLGKAGAVALWQRSITLTRRQQPGLVEALWGAGDPPVTELRTGTTSADPVVLQQACVAVLATFVNLIVSFIGEDLTVQVLCEVWPDAAPRLRGKKESP